MKRKAPAKPEVPDLDKLVRGVQRETRLFARELRSIRVGFAGADYIFNVIAAHKLNLSVEMRRYTRTASRYVAWTRTVDKSKINQRLEGK